MRLLTVRDVEGVTGIMDWRQANGDAPRHEEGRLYPVEINATVCGARLETSWTHKPSARTAACA